MKMTDDTPATKKDLHALAAQTKKDLHALAQQTKKDLDNGLKKMKMEIVEEIKRYFDVTVEQIRHDLLGVNRDEIEMIKDRVVRLEHHTGLVAL